MTDRTADIAWQAPIAGRALMDLGRQVAALREERDRLRERLAQALDREDESAWRLSLGEECAAKATEIAILRDEADKWQSAARVLCGAHVGVPQPACPVCALADLREERDQALSRVRVLATNGPPAIPGAGLPDLDALQRLAEALVGERESYNALVAQHAQAGGQKVGYVTRPPTLTCALDRYRAETEPATVLAWIAATRALVAERDGWHRTWGEADAAYIDAELRARTDTP